jgi:hypothetical protein
LKGRTAGHIFGREPSNDYYIKILFLLIKWFQTRRFLLEFPIGSYVKLSSGVAAILVGVLKYRTQFWKRTTQESFQQCLLEIGSVVSEEKMFFKFHPPFFLSCSSLCLYSSNLGTFWLKIEQFWPFEEISIFSHGGHLGYRTALKDTILKGDHPRIISAKFG